MSWRGGASAVEMYALAKQFSLVPVTADKLPTNQCSCRALARPARCSSRLLPLSYQKQCRAAIRRTITTLATMAVGSSSSSRLPVIQQLSESTSVLSARAKGQENPGVAYRAGKSDTAALKLIRASCAGKGSHIREMLQIMIHAVRRASLCGFVWPIYTFLVERICQDMRRRKP